MSLIFAILRLQVLPADLWRTLPQNPPPPPHQGLVRLSFRRIPPGMSGFHKQTWWIRLGFLATFGSVKLKDKFYLFSDIDFMSLNPSEQSCQTKGPAQWSSGRMVVVVGLIPKDYKHGTNCLHAWHSVFRCQTWEG